MGEFTLIFNEIWVEWVGWDPEWTIALLEETIVVVEVIGKEKEERE